MALFFLFMLNKEGKIYYAVFDPICFDRYVALIFGSCVLIICSADFILQTSFIFLKYLLVLHPQYDTESTVEARFKKLENEISGSVSGSSMISTLVNNTDLLACKAEYYHQCCQYQKCFELTAG